MVTGLALVGDYCSRAGGLAGPMSAAMRVWRVASMASTRPSSLSSRPESLAIIQPLNRAPAAASIADIAETKIKVSMAPRSYHPWRPTPGIRAAARRTSGPSHRMGA